MLISRLEEASADEEEVDWSAMKLAELRAACVERNLPISGAKAVLISRLEGVPSSSSAVAADEGAIITAHTLVLTRIQRSSKEETEDFKFICFCCWRYFSICGCCRWFKCVCFCYEYRLDLCCSGSHEQREADSRLPSIQTDIPRFVIDLDAEPEERWREVIDIYSDQLPTVLGETYCQYTHPAHSVL